MDEIIKINNHEVAVKEYSGQRVVTFKDIDLVHERPDGTANKRFLDNKKRFVEGEDYFKVSNSEIRKSRIIPISDNDYMDKIFVTEQGYLMLVKSFTDDLAWEVQRKLVNSYFKAADTFENMSTELKAVIVVDQRVTKIEKRVDHLENDIPLYGSEADELSRKVKKRGVEVLGGKTSNAYSDRKLRSEVYTDIYNQIKREFGLYDSNGRFTTYKALKRRYINDAHMVIENYIPPKYLAEKISDANAQIQIGEKSA